MDQWAGVGKRSMTCEARRLITLAGTSWSFDRASKHLKEMCRLDVSDDTIERVCQEEGKRAQAWMKTSDEPARAIKEAKGDIEFSTDGVKINTIHSWREMRLSTIARREPALPCEAGDWDQRVLNQPTARVSICAIANAEKVGAGWRRMSRQMRLATEQVVHVIADGAKWIWEQAGRRLPKHNGKWCVDVYHVSQHIHQCAKELFGENARVRQWADEHLMTALKSNGPALIQQIEQEQKSAGDDQQRTALAKLLTYLLPNRDRMWYADRLRAGQTIGSGLIEGGCKNTIGARLKLNSARWKIRRAERIGMLRCIDASNLWPNFWKTAA
jgi:hypothetical protein